MDVVCQFHVSYQFPFQYLNPNPNQDPELEVFDGHAEDHLLNWNEIVIAWNDGLIALELVDVTVAVGMIVELTKQKEKRIII